MPQKPAHTEKLLMRIRSVKWHAATIASSSHHATARAGAAAIVVELEAMELAAREPRTERDTTAGELQVDGLSARLTHLGPQWRTDRASPDLVSLSTILSRSPGVPVAFAGRRGTTPGKALAEAVIDADDAQLLAPAPGARQARLVPLRQTIRRAGFH